MDVLNSFSRLNERKRQHLEQYETKDCDVDDEKSSFQVSAFYLAASLVVIDFLTTLSINVFYDIKKICEAQFS